MVGTSQLFLYDSFFTIYVSDNLSCLLNFSNDEEALQHNNLRQAAADMLLTYQREVFT